MVCHKGLTWVSGSAWTPMTVWQMNYSGHGSWTPLIQPSRLKGQAMGFKDKMWGSFLQCMGAGRLCSHHQGWCSLHHCSMVNSTADPHTRVQILASSADLCFQTANGSQFQKVTRRWQARGEVKPTQTVFLSSASDEVGLEIKRCWKGSVQICLPETAPGKSN